MAQRTLIRIAGLCARIDATEAHAHADVSVSTVGAVCIYSDDAAGLRALAEACTKAADALDQPFKFIVNTAERSTRFDRVSP